MLDGKIRRMLDPLLDRLGADLARRGATADLLTVGGFALGVAAAALIAGQFYGFALLFVLASRICDGLDGAVARHTVRTDRGGYLDIVLDFAFYGLVPLAFVVARPAENGIAGAVLLAAFYVNGASFLAYAAIAEKRRLTTTVRGPKSLYFTTGLAEATETIAAFALFCLFPDSFPLLAFIFAGVCGVTAGARILLAMRNFG